MCVHKMQFSDGFTSMEWISTEKYETLNEASMATTMPVSIKNTEHGLFHILYVFAVLSPVYPYGHASMVNRAYK